MTTTWKAPTDRPAEQRAGGGLALSGWAIASVALFMLSLLVGVVFSGELFSNPFTSGDEVQKYFAEHHTMVQVVALLQFGSAVALALFTCVLRSRLRRLAPATSVTDAAAVGGIVASSFLALNALIQWVLTRAEVREQAPLVRAFNYLFFALGGPAHVVWLGLLLGGVSLLGIWLNMLPRWFCIAGLVITGLSVLSLLTLLTQGAVAFIPLGRFPGLGWLVVLSFLLPRTPTRISRT